MYDRNDRTIQRHLRVLVEHELLVVTLRGPKREMVLTLAGFELLRQHAFLTDEDLTKMHAVRSAALYVIEEELTRGSEGRPARTPVRVERGGDASGTDTHHTQNDGERGAELAVKSHDPGESPARRRGGWRLAYGGRLTMEEALRGPHGRERDESHRRADGGSRVYKPDVQCGA